MVKAETTNNLHTLACYGGPLGVERGAGCASGQHEAAAVPALRLSGVRLEGPDGLDLHAAGRRPGLGAAGAVAYCRGMTDSKIAEIQNILTEVDELLRQRLKALGVESEHVLLATLPNGAGAIRSNVGPEVLSNMAEMLMDIADDAIKSRTGKGSLN